MALGIHWEWRGFGIVSGGFALRYGAMEPQFPPQSVKDDYLWAPRLEANVKARTIVGEPFKLKRLQDRDGHLEKWSEAEEDIFKFPLSSDDWDTLAETLATADLKLGPYPSGSDDVDAEMTFAELTRVGARIVTVNKRREARRWQGPYGQVLVEWACILAPQALITIGLENWDEDREGPGLPDKEAKEDIRAAIQALGLGDEPLRVLNYVDAVRIWTAGGRI